MLSGLQSSDIRVIYDVCEECGEIVRVLKSGHLDKHKAKINRRWRKCHGIGTIADTVIRIYKADNNGKKTKRPTGSDK